MGTFYQTRWYLPPGANVSSELWDRADYGYKKEEDPYQVFFITYSRYLCRLEDIIQNCDVET